MFGGLFIISILFTGIGFLLSSRLKNKFAAYSQVPTSSRKSGAEIAQSMLDHYGVKGVSITSVGGQLTDHYNPANKTVNLSADVYNGRNVAAAAVAAHEVGHAIQHATAYNMLTLRSKLVPAVQIASSVQQYLFMFAMVGAGAMGNQTILMVVLAAFAVTSLFSLVTLPVEFDASRRALVYLNESGVAAPGAEYDGAKDALFWAAMTYVAAALAALIQFLYLLMTFLSGSDE